MTFDSLSGTIQSLDSRAAASPNPTNFIFEKGIAYSMNIAPFVITLDKDMINGDTVPLRLILQFPYGMGFDTLELNMIVGRAPVGNMFTHVTPDLKLTVSDFGQFGMGANSIYSAGGEGFKFEGSENLLYEAGIIIGRNSLQISSSVRDSLGHADQSDFSPVQPLSTGTPDDGSEFLSQSRFVDTRSAIPIPITVFQSVFTYDEMPDADFAFVKYTLINESNDNLTNLYFGFSSDFDLSAAGDRAGLAWDGRLFYQMSDSMAIGILSLTNPSGIMTIDNGAQKKTLTNQDKFDYIGRHGIEINDTAPADIMSIHSFGPFTISPFDSVKVDLALIAAKDLPSLSAIASRVMAKYLGSTGVDEGHVALPENFNLYQNYPNPFNPATMINFDLPKTEKITLTIYNLLGQEICTLYDGMASIGRNSVVWNGFDNSGREVASGLYLYRLTGENGSATRKMMLLK